MQRLKRCYMKKLLTFSTGCILFQMSVATIMAAELTPILDPNEYRQTLPGMPKPAKVTAVGTLIGYIQTDAGEPLSHGKVFFFNKDTGPPPAPEKYWRVPDRDALLDVNGGFSVELPPGSYYLSAIQSKTAPVSINTLQVGDIYYAVENVYNVLPESKNDLKAIKAGKPLSLPVAANSQEFTAIEGTVIDSIGKPLTDVVVFAHIKSELTSKPVYISERTDSNGAYQLRVAGAGTFYLNVANGADGGGSGAASLGTFYGGNNPIAVTVKEKEVLRGINIRGVEPGTARPIVRDQSNQ